MPMHRRVVESSTLCPPVDNYAAVKKINSEDASYKWT